MSTSLLNRITKSGVALRLTATGLQTNAVLTGKQLAFIRQHKPELMNDLRLNNFVDLVRSSAIDNGRLLDGDAIRAQLDADDAADLLHSTVDFRQAWALALAAALCRQDGRRENWHWCNPYPMGHGSYASQDGKQLAIAGHGGYNEILYQQKGQH